MTNLLAGLLIVRIARSHEMLLDVCSRFEPAQLVWRPSPAAPSAGFHAWHVARFADRLQARLPGMTAHLGHRLGTGQEIWEREALAAAWGFPETLGFGATGMQMDAATLDHLALPGREALFDYVRRAFAAASRAVGVVDESDMAARSMGLTDTEMSVGDVLLNTLTHNSRHLGMIEALAGAQGLPGSATV
jgi:hypothetical protein